jgi:hypothetical protein
MLIGVATRKSARSVRLPDGDLAGQARRATTKSSVSRRFVALSTAKLKEWLAADLSTLDLLVIQIDGLRVGDHVLVAAIGIDGAGDKHVLAVALGAMENDPSSDGGCCFDESVSGARAGELPGQASCPNEQTTAPILRRKPGEPTKAPAGQMIPSSGTLVTACEVQLFCGAPRLSSFELDREERSSTSRMTVAVITVTSQNSQWNGQPRQNWTGSDR